MKLRRVLLENVRSFLEPAELHLDGEISIVIGPNGGGKTNLLDTVTSTLRRHLLSSVTPRKSPTVEIPDRFEFVGNDMLNNTPLEPHSQGQGRQQRIEIEIEVTPRDIENIALMQANATEIANLTERRFIGFSIREAASWNLSLLSAGLRFTYSIINNGLQTHPEESGRVFQRYLALYEADSWLRDDLGRSKLSTPMVTLPVNRASGGFQSSLSLAGYNEFDHKRGVDAASSRAGGSIVTLAIGRIARRYRLLLENDTGKAKEDFYADPEIRSLTAVLSDLGYGWNLECIDPLTNQYDIQLDKQGSKFLVGAASSGEKELLTYLFAIYALNVRDALIVVDEPELHLHPRWQRTLLDLFERLSKETGNQFLLATHSPVFVSPSSIQYVSRVYSANQRSSIVRLKNADLPEPKHLFSIVNSQNNERMFFADKVVLVEGVSDRVFFDAVFQKLGVSAGTTRTCEIISVGGKGFFGPYEAILKACQVPYAVIADRDYLNQLGSADIKALFTLNTQEIKTDVVDNTKSMDGDSLASRLDEAIATGSLDDLRTLWEYIKARRRRLRGDLCEPEQQLIDTFVKSKREDNIFVLSKGDLESYLPDGYRSKQLDKLIRFIATDFWAELPDFSKAELIIIAEKVKAI
ncbi:AAA family ATPase [Rhodoferax antarcticus]|uniref:AAA family ATPase n=1 Tax=Rhodoferax antarcticus TaxID=81479 RepID=UPI0022259E52|nr:AAA family ATPase [Rhodoferax antarcticus]MCW2313705.1 putative ATP-dependent endonuclease of OLD family [Rhodoferax antarcticus]